IPSRSRESGGMLRLSRGRPRCRWAYFGQAETNHAASMKHLVGKIFLSHSALDKPFVRRLAARIRSEGFQTWLDEKDLVPGDALAAGISRAVDHARVVLVVVSKHSIRSKW